jgi:hypothetical protein
MKIKKMSNFLNKLRGCQDKKEGPSFSFGNESVRKDIKKREGVDVSHNNMVIGEHHLSF